MSGNWSRQDAHRLVSMLGRQLSKTATGHRDMTALVTFLAYECGWDAAAAVADVFDIDEPRQEQIYKRVIERQP